MSTRTTRASKRTADNRLSQVVDREHPMSRTSDSQRPNTIVSSPEDDSRTPIPNTSACRGTGRGITRGSSRRRGLANNPRVVTKGESDGGVSEIAEVESSNALASL